MIRLEIVMNIVNGYSEMLGRVIQELAKHDPKMTEQCMAEYVTMNNILMAQVKGECNGQQIQS